MAKRGCTLQRPPLTRPAAQFIWCGAWPRGWMGCSARFWAAPAVGLARKPCGAQRTHGFGALHNRHCGARVVRAHELQGCPAGRPDAGRHPQPLEIIDAAGGNGERGPPGPVGLRHTCLPDSALGWRGHPQRAALAAQAQAPAHPAGRRRRRAAGRSPADGHDGGVALEQEDCQVGGCSRGRGTAGRALTCCGAGGAGSVQRACIAPAAGAPGAGASPHQPPPAARSLYAATSTSPVTAMPQNITLPAPVVGVGPSPPVVDSVSALQQAPEARTAR